MTGAGPVTPEPSPTAREERLTDQAASMHAALRDRATRATTVITVTLLSASVVSIAFAFAGDVDHVHLLGIEARRSTWLGILAVAIFIGTLADLVTDRRGAARRHDAAVRLLADLKSAYRQPPASSESDSARLARLTERYQSVMAQLPPVPERSFNRLKAAHLRKVEVSKTLSAHPGISAGRAARIVKKRPVL